MTEMILVYITCESVKQARSIGKVILQQRLGACVNIFKEEESSYLWPAKSGKIESAHEVVLLVKTLQNKFVSIEKLVTELHTYEVPCIIALPVTAVAKDYYSWLVGELV